MSSVQYSSMSAIKNFTSYYSKSTPYFKRLRRNFEFCLGDAGSLVSLTRKILNACKSVLHLKLAGFRRAHAANTLERDRESATELCIRDSLILVKEVIYIFRKKVFHICVFFSKPKLRFSYMLINFCPNKSQENLSQKK